MAPCISAARRGVSVVAGGVCAKIGEAVGSKLRAKASISARTYGACRTSSPHVVQKHSETVISGLVPTSAVSTLSKMPSTPKRRKGAVQPGQRAEMPHGKGAYEVGWNCMDFNKNRSNDVYVADHCSDLAWRHEFVHFYPPAVEGRGDAGRRLPATPWAYHTPTRKQSYSSRVSHLKHSLGISGCAPLGSTVSWKSDATPCARGTHCTASLVGSWRVSLPLPPHVASGLHLLLLPLLLSASRPVLLSIWMPSPSSRFSIDSTQAHQSNRILQRRRRAAAGALSKSPPRTFSRNVWMASNTESTSHFRLSMLNLLFGGHR